MQEIQNQSNFTIQKMLENAFANLDELEAVWNDLSQKEKQQYHNNLFAWAKATYPNDYWNFVKNLKAEHIEDGDLNEI